MKKSSILIVILLLCVGSINAQNDWKAEITFGHKIVKLGVDTSAVSNNRVKNIIVKQLQLSKKALSKTDELYKLSFNNYESFYETLPFLNNDYNPILSRVVSQNKYYQNLLEGKSLEQTDAFGKLYLIDKPIKQRKWQIKKKTKTIAGFECKLAVAKEEIRGKYYLVKAWYTQEIPVSLGPQDFNGLPGMILAIEDKGNYYYAIAVKQKNNLSIKKPSNGKRISEQEYNKMLSKAIKSMRGE